MTRFISAPTLLDGLGTISEALELERSTAEDLVRSGFLGECFSVDGRTAAYAGRAAQLAERTPMLDPTDGRMPRALVVKVKPAQPVDDDDREYMGWHADLTPRQQADGVRGWWSVKDVGEWDSALLVATVAGFVVGVWRITGHETVHGRLHRFKVERADETDPEAAFYLGHRMKPIRGGVTLRFGES